MTSTCPNCGRDSVALRPLGGSFLYPPTLRAPEEIVDFWSRVEIPDEALARTQRVYRENHDVVTKSWAQHAWTWNEDRRWRNANPQPSADDPGEITDWEGREASARAEFEQALARRLAERPRELSRSDLRPVFRAAAMVKAAQGAGLSREEYLQVSNYVLDFSDGPRTVGDAAVETGLVGLASRFVNPENYDADEDGRLDQTPAVMPSEGMSADFDWDKHRQIVNEAVERAIKAQNQQLDVVFDEMFDNMKAMANLTVNMQDPNYGRKRRWSER